MSEKCQRQCRSVVLDLLPDWLLLLPSGIFTVAAITTGQIVDPLSILCLVPLSLLFVTYLQKSNFSLFSQLKMYRIRRFTFALFFGLMFLAAFGMAISLANGERLFPSLPYGVDILAMVGYFFTAVLFHRYGHYIKLLETATHGGG